jgi:hypothetical protein
MMRRWVLPACLLAMLAQPWASAAPLQRGVNWVAGWKVTAADLEPLVANHVDWIAQTPFGWQKDAGTPEVILATSGRVMWGETDEGLETTARLARDKGIKTLLKPHLWLMARGHSAWSGEIAMKDEEAWKQWFASYERFIVHYAELAERTGMEGLCVATELRGTVSREADWRRVIASVRKVYHGKLTWASNWYQEHSEIGFWDALDFIGMQAYFPLTKSEKPTLEELQKGWQEHLPMIEALARKTGKPIVFTEMGYRSEANAAIEPWRWPERDPALRPAADLRTQELCYEAFFRTFWGKDWVGGAYIWKWYPGHARAGGEANADFTPQNKPAEKVMARFFGGDRHAATGSP